LRPADQGAGRADQYGDGGERSAHTATVSDSDPVNGSATASNRAGPVAMAPMIKPDEMHRSGDLH
jgi:hypothetical protein